MKFSVLLMIAATASAAVVAPRHHKGKGGNAAAQTAQNTNAATQNAAQTNSQAATGGNTQTDNNQAATGATTSGLARGATTIVLKETNGVPGNECLTFRNNGELVDAACVNTAADRQVQASTVNGKAVLAVQRSFTAGFRPDLVGVDACVGNNGTTFKALPCNDANLDPVTFSNNQLVAVSGACQSGHDSAAQITIDTTGKNCAALTSTQTTASTT